jgi:hypothetical protein
MNFVRVEEPITFGPGKILGLTHEQVETRIWNLKRLRGGRYRVVKEVQFKRGEILQVDSDLNGFLKGKLVAIEAKLAKDLIKASFAKALESKCSKKI